MQHFLDYSSGRKHAETSFENLTDKSLCVCIDFQVEKYDLPDRFFSSNLPNIMYFSYLTF